MTKKEIARLRSNKWYNDNKEYAKKQQKKYRENNKEKRRE